MAFYAEMKRRSWWCVNGVNQIWRYSKLLYDEWLSSLSDEDKTKLDEYNRRKEERRQQCLRNLLSAIGALKMEARRHSPYL